MGGMRARTQYPAIVATMMVIAMWHDLSIPLVLFGIYHSAGLVLHRVWVGSRPVPADRSLVRRVPATMVFFVYFLISLPLLSLDLSQLSAFYERLLP
jgi:alginate O-acetyltransferase complex protein AlgI